MLTALRAAVAHYRIATTATSDAEIDVSADHAQACAAIAGIGGAASVVVLICALIALRCLGEAVGAFVASDVEGVSEWVRANATERAWSALGYALAWFTASWVTSSASTRVTAAMWASLRNEPEE